MPRVEALPYQPSIAAQVRDKFLYFGEKSAEKQYRRKAQEIIAIKTVRSSSGEAVPLTDVDLQAQTELFKSRLQKGEELIDILPEAFAVVCEATRRVLHKTQYEVQVMAGLALYDEAIAEMKTGEGKTLSSIMPAYLHALTGEPVHIATANNYLAERDAELLRPVYEALGMTVGVVLSDNPLSTNPRERHSAKEHRIAYNADVTFGTITEFGLDYLRDNSVLDPDDRVQRGQGFIIIDEADAVLIDEARMPLIIEADAEEPAIETYQNFAKWAKNMRAIEEGKKKEGDEERCHYFFNKAKRTVELTEKGTKYIEKKLAKLEGVEVVDLYDKEHSQLVAYLRNALKAQAVYEKDKEYLVDRDHDAVHLISEFTGRPLYGRRYHEGVHQAIEAKEGITIKPESARLAEISVQNYVMLYDKKAGMTGTADTDSLDFAKTYHMPVEKIPTRLPSRRIDHPDRIYKTKKAKFDAIADDIEERYRTGQPILVGTGKIADSEYLSELLKARNLPHKVLNAKNHAEEAVIIAEGGRRGSIIISTQMAGRGVDIKLGGDPEFLAEEDLVQNYPSASILMKFGIPKARIKNFFPAEYAQLVTQYKQETQIDAQVVGAVGGLYVIGTERNDSRRIDNQLRGRSGRQGDPGETQFYVSFEDEVSQKGILKVEMAQLEERFRHLPDIYPILRNSVRKKFTSAQAGLEMENFKMRRDVLQYDDVLNAQRKVVYRERATILESNDTRRHINNMIVDVTAAIVSGHIDQFGEVDMQGIWDEWRTMRIELPFTPDDVRKEAEAAFHEVTPELLQLKITEYLFRAYDSRVREVKAQFQQDSEDRADEMHAYYQRGILLYALDLAWKEHLTEMDILLESVQLRVYARRDPLVEYNNEGERQFAEMLDKYKKEVVKQLFLTTIQ